jgi:hypothetical protein
LYKLTTGTHSKDFVQKVKQISTTGAAKRLTHRPCLTRIKPLQAFILAKTFSKAIVALHESRMAPAFLRLCNQTTGMAFVKLFSGKKHSRRSSGGSRCATTL